MEKFIQNLVIGSGVIIKKQFKKTGAEGKIKGDPLDLVTKTDLASERFIISQIKKKFPTHKIISEESGDNNFDSEYVWVIDPLDGTLNFAYGLPLFVSQVALIKNGVIIYSALYDPIQENLFFASKGKGAFCNGKKIHCSQKQNLKASLPAITTFLNNKTISLVQKIISNGADENFRARLLGTIGLASCYAASGQVDYFFSNTGKFWDYAPAYLILKEAGCAVKNLEGRDWEFSDTVMIGANKKLMIKIIDAVSAQ